MQGTMSFGSMAHGCPRCQGRGFAMNPEKTDGIAFYQFYHLMYGRSGTFVVSVRQSDMIPQQAQLLLLWDNEIATRNAASESCAGLQIQPNSNESRGLQLLLTSGIVARSASKDAGIPGHPGSLEAQLPTWTALFAVESPVAHSSLIFCSMTRCQVTLLPHNLLSCTLSTLSHFRCCA